MSYICIKELLMSEQKEIELFRSIRENIAKAQRALYERKAKLGEPVVIADENGQPLVVSAEVALRKLDRKEHR